MQKDIIIKYLPYTTTQQEVAQIRSEYNHQTITLILIISGREKLLDNLQSLINID